MWILQEKCTWDPSHNRHMRDWFARKGKHRLKDMLQKARTDHAAKGKPSWIGEDAWMRLTAY